MKKTSYLTLTRSQLKDIVLTNENRYNLMIYRLLNNKILDDIIIKLDDVPIYSENSPNITVSSNEQFIKLLDRFIKVFTSDFPTLYNTNEYIIENIIITNKKSMKKYLLSKKYLGDNEHISFFNSTINKIILNNFLNNLKYMISSRTILEHIGIIYQCNKHYSDLEISKIIQLLSDIVFCNSNEFHVINLFWSIDEIFLELSKRETDNTDFDAESSINDIIKNFEEQYDSLFKNYFQKYEYLQYFYH